MENFSKEQKVVFIYDFLISAIQEIKEDIIHIQNEGNKHTRTSIAVSFIMLEIMSNFYLLGHYGYECVDKNKFNKFKQDFGNKRRMEEFMKNFCLVQENQEFRENKEFTKVNEHNLYELRNSIIHFFGMNSSKTNIIFATSKQHPKLDNYKLKFPKCAFIEAKDLFLLFIAGAKIFIEQYFNNPKGNIAKEESIDLIFNKIKEEGYLRMDI